VSRHVYFFIESTLILSLPPFCHSLLAVPKAEAKNRLFGLLFVFCAATIASPFFVAYAAGGSELAPRTGFYIYRGLFSAVMAYCIVRLVVGLRRLSSGSLRTFAGFALASLLFSLWELLHCELLPLLGHIPPTIPLSPAGYLVTNVLVTAYVIRAYLGSPRPEAGGDRFEAALADSGLSAREKEIVSLLVQGLRNKEIGERLFISDSTVKTHIKSVYRKLDVGSRVELMNALGKRT
jgi:DNA-binding CsgD family transcriptional regulator